MDAGVWICLIAKMHLLTYEAKLHVSMAMPMWMNQKTIGGEIILVCNV